MNVAIIGGGAAGFFAAIQVKENFPDSKVQIIEQSKKLLSKVRVSGGGRCNVTNGSSTISKLSKGYPRGEKQLKKTFHFFNNHHMMNWLNKKGIQLITEDDSRVFPASNNSQTIIDCFMNQCKELNIDIYTESKVNSISIGTNKIDLRLNENKNLTKSFDKVIIATGGSAKKSGFEWLEELGHKIEAPVPSLFSFNMPNEEITELMGISVAKSMVHVQGTKLKSNGPLLITHWGMSGPAILKLSSFGARTLHDKDYDFSIQLNWVNELNHEKILENLMQIAAKNPKKKLSGTKAFELPTRLWNYLLKRGNLNENKIWEELGKKGLNKLVDVLCNDTYQIKGKTTFKEEFVTCGGISLNSIDFNTMQSKTCKNLYFAGEVLNIDGITGGYNFQAAWTTAFIAAQLAD